MQISRLFEIVYILLDKKIVTAKELSERFEVSVRTIYRDIDVLSSTGIPIYTSKGKGGGISLIDNFVLNKSVLSDREQKEILMSLQSLSAMKFFDVEPVLKKMTAVFNNESMNWIDIDFSGWGNDDEKEKFNIIKTAIFNNKVISFEYFNSIGQKSLRNVEPLKIIFKGQGWYIYGFCKLKSEFRIFKITRIKKLNILEENFIKRNDLTNILNDAEGSYKSKMIEINLNIDEKMAYRVYDEFEEKDIVKNSDGSFKVTASMPDGDWIFGYIMSYGEYIEVIEPKYIREIIKQKFEEGLKKYS